MSKKILIGVIALVIAGSVFAFTRLNWPLVTSDITPVATTVTAANPIVAEARVVPVSSAALSFLLSGRIAEVLVQAGDGVRVGQVLARLDSAEQQARLARAEAQLKNAEAQLKKLLEGAQPEEIEVAQAQLAQAQALLQQTTSSVSAEDIVAAKAQIEQAQQLLARLKAGPKLAQIEQAQAQLAQAQSVLNSQRDQLSANKTQAELRLRQATEQLVQAQTTYSTAKWNWEHVQEKGTDPINPTVPDPANPRQNRGNNLNDVQKQQYQDAFLRAEAFLRSAEQAVREAQVAYDNARTVEANGVQQAEQQLAAAATGLEQVQTSIEPDQIAAAKAQLANARASLARLTGQPRQDTLDAAQAGVAAAQARLNQLLAGPRESDVAAAQAQVESAKAEVEVMKVSLANTELRAPFAGTVTQIDLKLGEYFLAGAPAAYLADTSAWMLETSDLTELSVVKVSEGDPAKISLDALPELELSGTVTRIESFGENKQGDITYTIVVMPDMPDTRLRWNMTASVSIEPQ